MKLEVTESRAVVEDVAVYGSDETIYKVARVCTGNGFSSVPGDQETLERFIHNLMRRRHMRCFEFCGIVFGIHCPIYVERQLRTYRKPELERSLRYCEPIELTEEIGAGNLDVFHHACLETYRQRRKDGASKEKARCVLPLDTLTEVVSYYNLRSLLHVFDERLTSSAQKETFQVVLAMEKIARERFPLTMKAYNDAKIERESE